jgi:hypothetical protein
MGMDTEKTVLELAAAETLKHSVDVLEAQLITDKCKRNANDDKRYLQVMSDADDALSALTLPKVVGL